jgi:hypothetical protein
LIPILDIWGTSKVYIERDQLLSSLTFNSNFHHLIAKYKASEMSSKNVAFVLVPGSFSPNTFYDAYPTPLLSAGERMISGPATMKEDAEFIHKRIEEVLDSGKDVILVMNSYGGFPGSESCQGLSKGEREKDEKQNGVVGLVYIASFLPPVGMTLTTVMGNDFPEFGDAPVCHCLACSVYY